MHISLEGEEEESSDFGEMTEGESTLVTRGW